MGIELFSQELGRDMMAVNLYGPYNDRVPFWENLLGKCSTKKEDLVLGGDLNFTVGSFEIWGPNAKLA